MDLPTNPELLEQRIGRLDRIGQKETIHIHVPYLSGTSQAVLAAWYHEGLGAFQENLPGGQAVALEVVEELRRATDEPGNEDALKALALASQAARARVRQQLAEGEDRLLELSTPSGEPEILPLLRQIDADPHFESFLLRLGDHCGLVREELAPRTYVWHPGHLVTDSLPAMPVDGLTVTFDRQQAVSREDWDFLTWDHPVALGALDYLLGSENGNTACVRWGGASKQGVWLEAILVAECIAPAAWHVDRFLPATPVRVVVDHLGVDWSQDRDLVRAKFNDASIDRLLEIQDIKETLLPRLLEQARELAESKLPRLIKGAQKRMQVQLDGEIARLESLQQRGNFVSSAEIQQLVEQRRELGEALNNAQLRLDAVRVIQGAE
jgi:ATP-dependent helicase HepA